jgi:hypothetical protein
MRARLAVALTVLAALLGIAGIVVEASFGVPVPGPFGVVQPQVWALAGLLPLLTAGVALSLIRATEGCRDRQTWRMAGRRQVSTS